MYDIIRIRARPQRHAITRRADSADDSEEDWDAVIDTNLKALFFTCKAFGKAPVGTGMPGAIVNIASPLSFQGGIRVPGYIATNNTEALRNDPGRSKAILERIPAGRWGEPSDIGGTAAFLASPATTDVTGAVINVDGGWLAR
ncbi:MAG: SDR family oxidoreductase [Rhodobacteraceae bacterium]|nr:SDR family oxidoreductase [Paracoccaceae bacterium]